MADLYIWSGGTNVSPYNSWVTAASSATTGLADAITASNAGDRIFINSGTTISNSSAQTYTFKGTAASPNQIFSVNTIVNTPPVAGDLLLGANVTTTGASSLTIAGTFYCYGVKWNAGSGATVAILAPAPGNATQTYDNCAMNLVATTASNSIVIGAPNGGNATAVTLNNTTVSFGAVGHILNVRGTRFIWTDTASALQGTVPTILFSGAATSSASLYIAGVDLSAAGAGKTLVGNLAGAANVAIVNCKLGSGVTVALTPTSTGNQTTDVIISDSSATGYRQERYWYQGTLTTSTGITNNASDGVTPISWNVTTTANANRPLPFECFQIAQWVGNGTYGNCTIALTSATANLTNADVWCDVQVLSSGATPVSTLTTSGPATQLTSGTNLANGTWATGGLAANVTIAIPAFTVATAGYQRFTVKVAKASVTVFVDPAVTVAA